MSAEVATAPPRLPQVRLSRQQQLELVERFRAGALRRELAEAYGIGIGTGTGTGTGTVSGILKRHGASRKIGLSEDEVEHAVESYETGQSLAQIGETFGVVAGTIRTALIGRGSRCGQRREPGDEATEPFRGAS